MVWHGTTPLIRKAINLLTPLKIGNIVISLNTEIGIRQKVFEIPNVISKSNTFLLFDAFMLVERSYYSIHIKKFPYI